MESHEQQPRQEQAPPRSKPPIRLLVRRGYTIIVLLITLILLSINLKTNDNGIMVEARPEPPPQSKISNIGSYPPAPPPQPTSQTTFEISPKGSQGSGLTASALGAGCSLFQFGMLVYCMVTGKDLTLNKYNILLDYCIDKAVALVLAAGAGVGLGPLLDIVKKTGRGSGSFTWDKIWTSLLASAVISTLVSSSFSATAMPDYKRTVEKAEKAVGKLGPWATKACNYCCEP